MNININLLPEEALPKPLIETRMLVLVVLVIALLFGCYYFYDLKSGSLAEAASTEKQIEATESQAMSMSSSPEVKEIMVAIGEAEAAKAELESLLQDYEEFTASTIMWGDVIQRLSARTPVGVTVNSITQWLVDTVEVSGLASTYEHVAAYATALESDDAFSDVPTREWNAETGAFSLTVRMEQEVANE